MNRVWPWVVLISGFLLSFIGVALMAAYVMEAIVGPFGEADRSLLFWYLPVLFIGIIGLGLGLSLGAWGFARLRKPRPGAIEDED